MTRKENLLIEIYNLRNQILFYERFEDWFNA